MCTLHCVRLDVLFNWETLLLILFFGGETHILWHCSFSLEKHSNSWSDSYGWKSVIYVTSIFKCFILKTLSDIISEIFYDTNSTFCLIYFAKFRVKGNWKSNLNRESFLIMHWTLWGFLFVIVDIQCVLKSYWKFYINLYFIQ